MIPLVEKSWLLYQATARFPVKTIRRVTAWLEDRYDEAPCAKVVMAIAVHYLILGMRHDKGAETATAEEYCDRAAYWQAKASESNAVPQEKGTETHH